MRTYKICPKCNKKKLANLKNFKPNPKMKLGLTSWCRDCKRAVDRIYSRKYRKEHPEWKKMDNKRNAHLIKAYLKKNKQDFPERYKARRLLNYAVRTGVIKKQSCKVCKAKITHAHHPDYSKPLEVIWLCPSHHKAIHFGLLTEKENKKINNQINGI
jgi:hypothetical protein